MAIQPYTYSFGDALLAAAQMIRSERLERQRMAVQEQQFQQELALRQYALEQDERQSVRTDLTTRRGQDLTFDATRLDREQRGDFHEDNLALSLSKMTLDERLAREQMLNARELARISSGGSGARDLLLRIQALAALDQLGFEASPSDLGLDFDLPRATGFTPPPSPLPFTATAGNVTAPFAGLLDITGGPQNRLFVTPGQKREAAAQYVQEGLQQYQRDLESRGRLSQIEAELYVSQLTAEQRAAESNPNLKNNPQALSEIVASIQALKGLALSKVRGANR